MIYNSFDNTGLVKVLTFLQTHNTEYLSGQDLSDVFAQSDGKECKSGKDGSEQVGSQDLIVLADDTEPNEGEPSQADYDVE